MCLRLNKNTSRYEFTGLILLQKQFPDYILQQSGIWNVSATILYLWRPAMSSWVLLQRLSRTCFVFPVMSCCSCKVYQIKMQPGETWIVNCANLIFFQLLRTSQTIAWCSLALLTIPVGCLMYSFFSLNTEKLDILKNPVPDRKIWLPPSWRKQCFICPVFQKPDYEGPLR